MQGSTANVCMSIKVTGTFPALRRRVSESENTSLESWRRPTLNGQYKYTFNQRWHTEKVLVIFFKAKRKEMLT